MNMLVLLVNEYLALVDTYLQLSKELEDATLLCDKRRAEVFWYLEVDRLDNTDRDLGCLTAEPHYPSMLTKNALKNLLELTEECERLAQQKFKYSRAMDDCYLEYLRSGGTDEGWKTALEAA